MVTKLESCEVIIEKEKGPLYTTNWRRRQEICEGFSIIVCKLSNGIKLGSYEAIIKKKS